MSPAKAEYTSAIEKLFNNTADWSEFYGEMVEEDPPGMPKPLGTPVKIKTLLDADHAGNVVTRRSHTGILIFVNNALIVQYSKKQNTVESATFGAEMVAMRVARDLTVALRIKLKMFGVPIDGPADFSCDNDSVVKNTSIPTRQHWPRNTTQSTTTLSASLPQQESSESLRSQRTTIPRMH